MSLSSTARFSPIAVLDEQGKIVEVNQAWKAFGDQNGLPEGYTSVGKNYVAIAQRSDDKYGVRVATELRRLLNDEQTEFTAVYPCHSPNQERWFRLYATAVSLGHDRYYFLVHQRLDQDPPSKGNSPSEVGDAPTRSTDYRDCSRLVTYSLSSNESATEGLFIAFDAIGIDIQSQETTLQDWTDPDVIDALRTSTSDFHLTFRAWNYPVSLTPEEVIIFAPE
jgi:hypothetical protein